LARLRLLSRFSQLIYLSVPRSISCVYSVYAPPVINGSGSKNAIVWLLEATV
jgi:hypothetical protein